MPFPTASTGGDPASHAFECCVPEWISFHARIAPGTLAVASRESSITYAELDAGAELFARHLRSLGVASDVVVGICLPRSIGFVVSALGVMKAGGAYLPLDPSRPQERFALELEDAHARFLVASDHFDLSLSNASPRIVLVSPDGDPLDKISSAPSVARVRQEDLAYVIYTSGSTGRPKGVEIEHRSLNNLIAWHRKAFQVTSADRASQISGVEFDAAVWELWPYLAAGASVHIADDFVAKDPALFQDWLLTNEITISFAPSPLAEHLLALEWPSRTALRILLTGADILHRYPPAGLPFQLVNNYGPTECTVVATSACVPVVEGAGSLPPIGRAISGVQVHILDEDHHPVSQGCQGEIWIAGRGLARGYRNDPAMTAEKFLPNPFTALPNSHMYCTGDIGRALADGQIAFLGRVDDQIKIRGIRIEPAEIEAVLNQQPGVQESAVVISTSGERRLVAYLVMDPSFVPSTEIRRVLAERLPEFMIPSALVPVSCLPLTSSGKIDRAALRNRDPAPELKTDTYVAPRNAVEKRLTAILALLLELDKVSIEDNFFMLGGHSLLGTQLIARIRDAFGVEMSLRFLFEFPTIAAIAREVERLLILRFAALGDEHPELFTAASRFARGGD